MASSKKIMGTLTYVEKHQTLDTGNNLKEIFQQIQLNTLQSNIMPSASRQAF